MQVQANTGATGAKTTGTLAAKAGSSAGGATFTKAMNQQSTDTSVTRNARSSARKMRSILVPSAASTTPTASTQTATRHLVTARETEAKYGRGTLATILARIRQG